MPSCPNPTNKLDPTPSMRTGDIVRKLHDSTCDWDPGGSVKSQDSDSDASNQEAVGDSALIWPYMGGVSHNSNTFCHKFDSYNCRNWEGILNAHGRVGILIWDVFLSEFLGHACGAGVHIDGCII